MDYTKLQNGSDIRGVAMEGIEGQHVNLTEQACRDIGRGFALWLRARLRHDRGVHIDPDTALDIYERLGARANQCSGVDQTGIEKLFEHQVASRQRAFRRTSRIVVARPLDQTDEQGDIGGIKRLDFTTEIELGSRGESMHSLAALLAEKDLVDVGFEDAALVVAEFDQQGDQRFVDLAHDAAPAIEEQVLDQLLGQRRAALNHAPRTQIDPTRAQDRDRINPVVALEIPILDGLQAGHEQGRQLFELNQPAFFLLRSIKRRDARWIEFGLMQGRAGFHVEQIGDVACNQIKRHSLGRIAPLKPDKRAPRDLEMLAIARIGSGRRCRRRIAIARSIELKQQGIGVQWAPRREIERSRKDPARNLPTQIIEALAHLVIERDRIRDEKSDQRTERKQGRSTENTPKQSNEGKQTS